MHDELQAFLKLWDEEAKKTVAVLRELPRAQYDFRPDAGGRSLGELAWHLSELDGYISYGVEQGKFDVGAKPPHIERPKTVEALAPGYERIHTEAAERIRKLTSADLDRKIVAFGGTETAIRDLLWSGILLHLAHHRGQLSVLTRLAGGGVPGLFGPNREETAAMRARAANAPKPA
ncbi:MAG: DinB family protein [Acidobacteriota bacterium]|nr:DinB family protein [Acidobacteriota bacterium]